jgi:nicotinate-nucleotide pyrophosphorylase (carboxylating)
MIWRELVKLALLEDGSAGDPTTESIIAADRTGVAHIVARQPLIVSGLIAAKACFRGTDRTLTFEAQVKDGAGVERGQIIAVAAGPLRSLLVAERPALNFLQRLCGVATWTAKHVELAKGTGCRVADTRKTLPGYRALDKAAVRHGGGVNHRHHLGDGVLIKDNHVAAAGSVAAAISAARAYAHHLLRIECEVDDFDQLDEALAAGADCILVDNMSPDQVAEAVRLVDGRAFLEASGGIDLHTLAAYAATGVDQVALGALTHSAPAADVALDLVQGL